MRRKRRVEDRQILGFELLPGYQLCHPASCLRRVGDSVSTKPKRIDERSLGIWSVDARHHIVANIDPAPPRVFDFDTTERRELPSETFCQKLKMPWVGCVGTRNRAPAADLKAIVR